MPESASSASARMHPNTQRMLTHGVSGPMATRTIEPSPFGGSRLYYGGHDFNFYPADETTWIAFSTLGSIPV